MIILQNVEVGQAIEAGVCAMLHLLQAIPVSGEMAIHKRMHSNTLHEGPEIQAVSIFRVSPRNEMCEQ